MQAQLRQTTRGGLQRTDRGLKSMIDQWRTCRECAGSVTVLDRICRHCGARHPVKISAAQSILLTAALGETLLLLLCFR